MTEYLFTEDRMRHLSVVPDWALPFDLSNATVPSERDRLAMEVAHYACQLEQVDGPRADPHQLKEVMRYLIDAQAALIAHLATSSVTK